MIDIFMNLEFPPTVNSYYVKTKRGVFISKKGRQFRDAVIASALEQNAYKLMIDNKLTVDVILYPPDRRTRDLDNYMKALLDALTHAKVWGDDSQIDNLNIHRGIVVKHGMARLRIAEHHGMLMPDSDEIWDSIE